MGAVVVFGMVYSKTHQVVIPWVTAVMVGIPLEPAVSFMARHRVPRRLATLVMRVMIVAVVAEVIALIVYGVFTQAEAVGREVERGVARIQDRMDDLKVSGGFAQWAQEQIEKAWPSVTGGVAREVAGSIRGLTSFLVGAFIAFFILMSILADDGTVREWVAGHRVFPRRTGRMVLDEVAAAPRGYFRGTAITAAFDSALIVIVALILGLPPARTIGAVSLVTRFIPSFGGYLGGGFAVLAALASQSLTAGVVMSALTSRGQVLNLGLFANY